MNEQEINARANEAAKRAQQMPPEVQYAIVVAAPNARNGAFWGFTDLEGVQKHLDALRRSAPKLTARKLGNACIIEVDPAYLLTSMQTIDPNAVTSADLAGMEAKRAEAHVAFEKFLIRSGKSIEKTGKPYQSTIGIYCVNDVTTIAYRGVNYPAFRLAIGDALRYLSQYGYKVRVGNQYVFAQQAGIAQVNNETIWDTMVLSPTKTGVFIDIAATFTADQYKELERIFKARTSAKR